MTGIWSASVPRVALTPPRLRAAPVQVALSLEGLQKESLVRFDNAARAPIAMLGNGGETTMPRQEGRVLLDAAMLSRSSDGEAIDQGLGVSLPSTGLAQMR